MESSVSYMQLKGIVIKRETFKTLRVRLWMSTGTESGSTFISASNLETGPEVAMGIMASRPVSAESDAGGQMSQSGNPPDSRRKYYEEWR